MAEPLSIMVQSRSSCMQHRAIRHGAYPDIGTVQATCSLDRMLDDVMLKGAPSGPLSSAGSTG